MPLKWKPNKHQWTRQLYNNYVVQIYVNLKKDFSVLRFLFFPNESIIVALENWLETSRIYFVQRNVFEPDERIEY